jgi:hypothetical protein
MVNFAAGFAEVKNEYDKEIIPVMGFSKPYIEEFVPIPIQNKPETYDNPIKYRAAGHNLALYSTPDGILQVSNHVLLSMIFNNTVSGTESKIKIFRPYWLGTADPLEIPAEAESPEDKARFVSERLKSDLVDLIVGYRTNFNTCSAREGGVDYEIPDHKKKSFGASKTLFYRDRFKTYYGNSQYTYKLIRMIVEEAPLKQIKAFVQSLYLPSRLMGQFDANPSLEPGELEEAIEVAKVTTVSDEYKRIHPSSYSPKLDDEASQLREENRLMKAQLALLTEAVLGSKEAKTEKKAQDKGDNNDVL